MKKVLKILIVFIFLIILLITINILNSSKINILTGETSLAAGSSASDIQLMARAINGEARGEPYEGQVAVGAVILNRVKSGKYPPSVKAVITQENAFSCVSNGTISVTPNEACYNAVYDALKGNDPTGNALFFYNPSISTCSWMENIIKKNATSIGNHVFFSI